MLGWTLRSSEAVAFDGGRECSDEARGELLEVRRTAGTQPVETQTFWRARAVVAVRSPDPFEEVLNIFTDYVETEDDILFLEAESGS